jgi:signal transduction histidine kinase
MPSIPELLNIQLFEDATDDELQWLIDHSREVRLEPSAFFHREGQPTDQFYVVLDGELQITRTFEGESQPRVVGTTPRGIIGGELPLLFGGPSPSTSQAIVPCRLLVLKLPAFRAMFGQCPTVGARVLRIAAERTRGIATIVKQQEKMAALGKFSAGLAHELNNPAAAARSAAGSLRQTLGELREAALQVGALALSATQRAELVALDARLADLEAHPHLSPLERSDREDTLGTWLDERGIAEAWNLAPTLVEAGLTLADLEALEALLPPGALAVTLTYLSGTLGAAVLIDTLEQSSARISKLIEAVKSYTYMDQGQVQAVDIHQGLESTLTILGHKLRKGSLRVTREFDPELPTIMARGSELNQVWTNLIDNAIDALDGQGELRLITRCENNFVMVEVADNGPGIPPTVLPRIFEPFFTTKGVGQGSGLGLDTSYRIVNQHGGSIEAQSAPGNTRFIVRLPVASAEHQE